MELTVENLEEWKTEVTNLMFEQHEVKDFGNCCSDEEWLEQMEGATPQDAIDAEVEYWD